MVKKSVLSAFVAAALAVPAVAQDWNSVGFVDHSTYQAVNADGTSAYAGGFPIRLRGVVLNDTHDWLDPTPAYDPNVHLWQMGGEAEFYVQATNLDGTAWDSDPNEAFDDFGGTASWIGQNYGNHIMHEDPYYSYTDAEWTAELGRLNLYGGDGVTDPVRAGDLVEIRARAGLNYKGKMNVNEQHSKDPNNDFEVVILQQAYGLPTPTPITLGDVKDANDADIFDANRQTGGELHQSTLVKIRNVTLQSTAGWGSDSDLTLLDAAGRTLPVHLGLDNSFDSNAAPDGLFDVVGIMDQSDFSGTGGYSLLVMHAGDFTAPAELGDVNGDGNIDNLDITPFIRALSAADETAFLTQYPDGFYWAADCHQDGNIDNLDITPFVTMVSGAGDAVPEPTTMLLIGLGACLAAIRRPRAPRAPEQVNDRPSGRGNEE